ncbi:Ig-like domain-containing protein [Spirosoma validum]|uniref:Ig-like domain-containing protein n=1 Tax=Spirosoma validum TaxID=2771355 RepID=A0A927GFM1_9BACT|nr:hypothetical protein [Spirosoma validum]MBD2755725.1 hypothetical protein [Spirosoma validum]
MSQLSSTKAEMLIIRSLGLGLMLGLLLSSLALAQKSTVVAGGNGTGAAANQLNFPLGVVVDGAGNIYVADYQNFRVQKFPPNSTSATEGITVVDAHGYALIAPSSLAIDGAGNIYVLEEGLQRVVKFPPNFTSATEGTIVAGGLGDHPLYDGPFNQPNGVVVDGAGNIYVTDSGNARIRKFPPNSTSATEGITVAGGNGQGSAANQFNTPFGKVAVDDMGNFYVADYFNDRVLKFPPNSTSATMGITVVDANQVIGPCDLEMDRAGNLYVADQGHYRVLKFPPNSTSATEGITVAGGNGLADLVPGGMYIDDSGNLFVTDPQHDLVRKYSYPAVILSQPAAGTGVCPGATVTAQVSATATNPSLTYQWYTSGGNPLSGQTSPTLTLTNVQISDKNSYYVTITTADGVSVNSTDFNLDVLALPMASLAASGSLSPATPSVTLTASGGGSYEFGPGATQLGNGPTATVIASGLYYVKVTGTNGCSAVASTSVSQLTTPDLIPLLYARPTALYGTTPVTVVVDVVEVAGIASSGPIIVKITQDTRLSLALPVGATSVGNRSVDNRIWQLSGPAGGYYTLTTSEVVPAGGRLSVGLMGDLSPGGTTGGLTVSGTLSGGGDQQLLNNVDADRLEYFQ